MIKQKGFNLIELMVVVAVVGILMTIGWPLYVEQGRINNRTDAILATTAVSLALTQFASDNVAGYVWNADPNVAPLANAHNRYLPMPAATIGVDSSNGILNNNCMTGRGFRWVAADARYESCRGLYSIAVDLTPDFNGLPAFTVTTTAIAGRQQDIDAANGDHECNAFTLTNTGLKGHLATEYPFTKQGTAANLDGDWHSTKRCWTSS